MDGSGEVVDMFHTMQKWLNDDNTKVIYFLVLILIANMVDFLAGWINAKFNPNIKFSSSRAIYGIARKMIMFILCVFFVPISLLVPYPVGIASLYVFLIGYLISEINSILSHMRLSEDDKTTDYFSDFIKRLFKK